MDFILRATPPVSRCWAKKKAAVGDEAENSHWNSQPFGELALLHNGIAAVATIASA